MIFRATMAAVAIAALTTGDLGADQQGPVRALFADPELSTLVRQVPMGGALGVEGVDLDGKEQPAVFELERVRVFAPGARIVVHGDDGERFLPVPDNVYFRGSIAGDPRSSVFLTSLAAGGLRGIVASAGEFWIMSAEGRESGSGLLELRRVDAGTELAAKAGGFSCGTDGLDGPGHESPLPELIDLPPMADKAGASYTARVAVETDFEFFQKFGNVADAVDYVGDLFAFSSGIYAAEVATTLLVSHLSLWTTSGDPWTQSSSSCAFLEFGRYWNYNRGSVERTIAHFLSGKSTNSGIAWVGVLCSGAFSYSASGCSGLAPTVDLYGGGYGFTGGIDGNFNINSPSVLWDVVATTHEIGHNFNSGHSHCYEGVGGVSQSVDQCYGGQCGGSGCYCGGGGLPCGQPGAGCGTIMSYCHLLSGGLGNISLTFGLGHPYGVAPARVPTRMNQHVVSRASSNPSCLALEASDQVFADGFESGNTSAW